MSIEITNLQSALRVPRKRIAETLTRLLRREKRSGWDVTVTVVDDRMIRKLHREWFDDDTPTDVITFPLGNEGDNPVKLLGEVVVSADTAIREAANRPHGPQVELLLYAVHGCLHLLGYDDLTEEQREEMRRKERETLRRDLFRS